MFDDYFKSVQRAAIYIKPRQPLFDWLLQHDPESDIDNEAREPSLYLLPDFENMEKAQKWLHRNFSELFEELLFGWYTDEAMWPQRRSYKMFEDWFEFSLCVMVHDTQKGFIEKL